MKEENKNIKENSVYKGSGVFFSSDSHMGHSNIIKYCSRPFADVNHMDEHLIEQWNNTVGPNDTIYHLGDFSFGDHSKYLNRLNGRKILIKGNHEKQPSIKDGWTYIHDFGTEIKLNGLSITLCHYKMSVFNKSHHGAIQFYGHSHGTLLGNKQQLDVGVDNVAKYGLGYRPVSLDEALKIMKTLPDFKRDDYHGD